MEGVSYSKEVLKLDNESIPVDPQEVLRLRPVFPEGARRHAPKTWPDEEEKDEIALLTHDTFQFVLLHRSLPSHAIPLLVGMLSDETNSDPLGLCGVESARQPVFVAGNRIVFAVG
jgi:hypothetical protein